MDTKSETQLAFKNQSTNGDHCFHPGRDDADLDAGLAKVFFPFYVVIRIFYSGTPQCLVGKPHVSPISPSWGLAPCNFSLAGCIGVRFFLGDVEFLFISKVGLSCTFRRFLAYLRDAAAGIWRVLAFWDGVVRPLPSPCRLDRQETTLVIFGSCLNPWFRSDEPRFPLYAEIWS